MLYFPHPSLANEDGILAVGGDLSAERLLLAYRWGIFPWYNAGDPIIWWHPDPRFVLFPKNLKIAKSMRPYFNQQRYEVTYNQNFKSVINQCQKITRDGQAATWITDEMKDAYIQLHKMGYAQSVEVWRDKKLVGGLYGISLGRIFYGESMFSLETNASKYGFITLVQKLKRENYVLIDCQQETQLLRSMGADFISRDAFMGYLKNNMLL